MEIRTLIPKDKHDHHSVKRLNQFSFEQLEPIMPDLLEWLQDMNWPIGRAMADFLQPHVDRLTPEIIKIFRTDDGMWKFWVLVSLLRHTTNPVLLEEIERIAKFPTKDEIEEEVNIEAISILNGDYKIT
jgi:hypothetical protein